MTRVLFLFIILLCSISISAQKLKTVTKKFPSSNIIKTSYSVLKNNKNIKHGDYKVYFKNGQVKLSGTYHQNRKVDAWKEFNEAGVLRRTKTYQKGKLISNKKNGVWRETTSEGKIRFYDYDKNERIFPQIPLRVKYPSDARESYISGIVKIKVILDEECETKVFSITKSLGGEFDVEASKAVKDYLKKLKFYAYDCPGFNETFTFSFNGDELPD